MMIAQVQMLASSSPTITILTTMSACRNRASGDIIAAVVRQFQLRHACSSPVSRSNRSTHARGWRLGLPSGEMKAAVTVASVRMSPPRMTR